MDNTKLKAPFPYFGGKSLVAARVWAALGTIKRYIEPCFGSGAVLLARPDWMPGMNEIVCDLDGNICNAWRSLKFAPEEVAYWCDWPVHHLDLNARRNRLRVEQDELAAACSADADFYNAKLAGYWIWCSSTWIGSGLLKLDAMPMVDSTKGVNSKRTHLLKKGCHAGQIPHIKHNTGICKDQSLQQWFDALSERLRSVKTVCGDWSRVCGGNWQDDDGICGMFFDPPYSDKKRDKRIYQHESLTIAGDIAAWSIKRANSQLRIVIAGYDGEHPDLISAGWRTEAWTAHGGYSNMGGGKSHGAKNRFREMLYFSPDCVEVQPDLFNDSQNDKTI